MLRFCRPGSFYHRYASLSLSQSVVVSPRRDVRREFYLSAFSMGTCACRWRAHVVNQWQREQSESARENRRTRRCCRSSVNTCPLPLNQVFEMYIRAHVLSHDDAIGRWCRRNRDRDAMRDEKENLSLFHRSRTSHKYSRILSVVLTSSIYNGMKKMVRLCDKKQ